MNRSTVTLPLLCALLLASAASPSFAQKAGDLEIEGYAVINYLKYNWDTDPQRRAAFDLERVTIEPTYYLTDKIRLEAEVEFEHGGTGSTMEFDKFEEFGEYEAEVEKGGEVALEKLAAIIQINPALNVRLGHFTVPVGLVNTDHEPEDYFTTGRSESEVNIIPAVWHETGVGLFGDIGPFRYQAALVNGLDATGFSSATWIVLGRQTRFEMVNAENLAVAGRIDYRIGDGTKVGVSGYYGNSADNRPKPDMTVPAHVGIAELHAVYDEGPLTARGQVLYGMLENSSAVSKANRNLSNNLNVKRTPVGSAALGWFVEAGYDVLSLFGSSPASDTVYTPKLNLFARYDYYDTMFDVAPDIFDNPRWERSVWTGGVNYRIIKQLIIKGQFSHRTLGLPTANREDTFSLGLGMQI